MRYGPNPLVQMETQATGRKREGGRERKEREKVRGFVKMAVKMPQPKLDSTLHPLYHTHYYYLIHNLK